MRRVIVSGGGTGIGRAAARRFALAGDQVTIVGRRETVLTAAGAEISAEAGGTFVRAITADLSQPDEAERVAATFAADGQVDVVVNNAGGVGSVSGEGLARTAADWEGELRGNVL